MTLIPPPAEYARVFAAERVKDYPVVDALEASLGYAVGRSRLEQAARVLACPVKVHAPNWQHGRVLYAVSRSYLAAVREPVTLLDIGTAKGFSALCLEWARTDATAEGRVVSVDVIDPASHARRNTVAECTQLKTLAEIIEPWPESQAITFLHTTSVDWLSETDGRVHLAYVDGKHDYDTVQSELALIASRQEAGDRVVVDDLQVFGVARAVSEADALYTFERIDVLPHRAYALGVRR